MLEDFTNGQGNSPESSGIYAYKNLILYCDGGCEPNPGGIATAGWVVCDGPCQPGNLPLAQENKVVRYGRNTNDPIASNNYAEYCALGLPLRFLKDRGWHGGSIQVFSDSKLLVNQIGENWKCNKKHLQELRTRIWDLIYELGLLNCNRIEYEIGDKGLDEELLFGQFQIKWVPRTLNELADELSNKAYQEYLAKTPHRPRRKRPPKRKFKAGEQLFHCESCGHKGTVADLHIEDGDLACPICQMITVIFE